MKTDFSINVQIGVTPEVVALVSAILHSSRKQVEMNGQEDGRQIAGDDIKPAKTENTATQAIAPDNGKQQKDQDRAAADEPTTVKPLTEEDVRAAMHRIRQRIEGEDYKENTTGEKYKKYHKALSTQFKQIAVLLGAEKPSLLPADKRKDFIQECEQLEILEDGTIGVAAPF